MPKTATYAFGSVAALALLVGGSMLLGFFGGRTPESCGGAGLPGENATIGGPFRLVNGAGVEVTDESVISSPSLVYFGYTWCPDVCPFDAARNAAAVDLLAGMGVDASPVFITVDPGRDTPEVVAEYAEIFHPKMVGLSGTLEQVADAAKQYRVFYRKHDTGDEDYLVDHSTFTYLAMPGAGVVDYFRRDDSAEILAERTACQVNARS